MCFKSLDQISKTGAASRELCSGNLCYHPIIRLATKDGPDSLYFASDHGQGYQWPIRGPGDAGMTNEQLGTSGNVCG